MNTSLIAIASTPTTTTTQPTTQQTGGASTGIPGWLSVDVPLLGALGIGTVIAALITVFGKHWSDIRLNEQQRRHEVEFEEQRQCYEKERDEFRRQHERELEQVKTEYEGEKEKRAERRKLVKQWRELYLNVRFENTGNSFMADPIYLSLEPYLSDDARKSIEHVHSKVLYTLHSKDVSERFPEIMSVGIRKILIREIDRIEKEWGLI